MKVRGFKVRKTRLFRSREGQLKFLRCRRNKKTSCDSETSSRNTSELQYLENVDMHHELTEECTLDPTPFVNCELNAGDVENQNAGEDENQNAGEDENQVAEEDENQKYRKEDLEEEKKSLEHHFFLECLKSNISLTAQKRMWNWVLQNAKDVSRLQARGQTFSKTISAIRTRALKDLNCNVIVSYQFRRRSDKKLFSVRNVRCIRKKRFNLQQFSNVSQMARIKIQDLMRLHARLHRDKEFQTRVITLSYDGVQETRSRTTSLEVYALRFHGCRNIYPVCIKKVYPPEKPKDKILKRLVKEINMAGLEVAEIIADTPARKKILCLQGATGYYGCGVCTVSATSLIIPGKPSKRVWPHATANGSLRTRENTLDYFRNWLDPEERESFGVQGKSALFALKNFDPLRQVRPESMHLVMNVVKLLISLTIGIGPRRPGSKHKRLDSSSLNNIITGIKVPSEFSNTTRPLDLSWKAEELRNLIMFFFPAILGLMDFKSKFRGIWARLAFIMRAYSLPPDEFANISAKFLRKQLKKWYRSYEDSFGVENCTLNIHLISHMEEMRELAPLNERSAFPFESMFADMKNAYHVGTINVTKQIFQNMLPKILHSNHMCVKTLKLSCSPKEKTNDSLVYCFNDKRKYMIYKLSSEEEHSFIASKVIVERKEEKLPWHKVGVFEFQYLSSNFTRLDKDQIIGKCIRVKNWIMTIPPASCREN